MPVQIIRNDITKMEVDAIVNPSNRTLTMSDGLNGRILQKAGEQIINDCLSLGGCSVGEAKITNAYALPAKYVIHTVGPEWKGGNYGEKTLLGSCYKKALKLADEYNCESIAFPLIASGAQGYPKDEALNIALNTVGQYLMDRNYDTDITVYIVVYDKEGFRLGSRLFPQIKSYIDDNYAIIYDRRRNSKRSSRVLSASHIDDDFAEDDCSAKMCSPQVAAQTAPSLEEQLSNLDESFSEMLIRKIDEKGIRNSDCYKKANIDRKLFSKIVNDKYYKPKKTTAVAFAVALELSLEETNELLKKAGYALSYSDKFDVIIRYVISNSNYRINDINVVLFEYDQPLLGSVS
ncbi:MAG: RNase III inhibitor [Anaerofustis stercorihominis]|nr:RNase III inhibitor [Anaerofustis stercorihominis]